MSEDNPRLPTAANRPVRLVRPEINAGQQDLAIVSAEAWQALKDANDPPCLFVHGDVPVRIVPRDDDVALEALTVDRMRHELARVASWYRNTIQGRTPAKPPVDVVKDMLAQAVQPLPELIRFTRVPVYMADGHLLQTSCYDAESQIYYAQPACLNPLPIPSNPTSEDLNRAKAILLEEVLGDFPLVAESDRAHAVALAILPFVRSLIDGPTPLHLVDKPTPRTGAGLMVDALLRPAIGGPIPVMTLGRNEDETRRTLTARLMGGPTAILIDNATELGSAALSGAITAWRWTDRLVGTSRDVCLRVQCAWVATGNNVGLSSELTPRTVRCRLDAGMDHPETRSEFRHPALLEWIDLHRGEVVWALLVLCQAWVAEGCAEGPVVLGGFESWSRTVGGILEVVQIPGFLQDREQLYAASDDEGNAKRILIHLWWERFADHPVGVGQLFPLISEGQIDLDLGDGSDRSQRSKLGRVVVRWRDTVIDGFRIVSAGDRQRAQLWKLARVDRTEDQLFDAKEAQRHGGPGAAT